MDKSATSLRADAERLAQQLQGLSLQINTADTLYPGAASRKRAGSGEQFSQYRRYAQTDAADRIDWRRSARSDDHFVRETELETARTILFWADPDPGFDWAASDATPPKAARAKTIMLSLGIVLANAGERLGVLGSGRSPRSGKGAANRLAEDLVGSKAHQIESTRGQSLIVLASDFYAPIGQLSESLSRCSQTCREGVLLRVTDPIEHEFPFAGRTRFHQPGSDTNQLFGRAETVRDGYLEKFAAHSAAIQDTAERAGWSIISHRTDEPALNGASDLLSALTRLGQNG